MKTKLRLYACRIILTVILTILPYQFTFAHSAGIILSDNQGHTLYAKNQDKYYIPASTLKILTSLAAIKNLNKNFHFSTWACFDETTKNIYIKGFGDPVFTSEEINRCARQIAEQFFTGKTESLSGTVNNIVVDQTYFDSRIKIPGAGSSANPYDATNGALCANFNTIFLKWKNNQYVSAEAQTPFPEIIARQLKPGTKQTDRILLSYDMRRRYAGLLLQEFLKEMGVKINGTVQEGMFNTALKNRIEYTSTLNLTDIIRKLLRYSNNFMANQIMLTMGARSYGPPATLDKGVAILNRFARAQLGLRDFAIVEGSGLSRQNKLTPLQMRDILLSFMPFYKLMRRDGNEFYKTGTLSDVKTRAGYIKGKNNQLYPFVIMLNQTEGNNYEAIRRFLHEKVTKSGNP